MNEITDIINFSNNTPQCKVTIIGTEGNTDDEFLFIKTLNISKIKLPIQKKIHALSNFQENKQEFNNTMNITENRQREYVDLGYCSNQNCGRRAGCDLGLVIPCQHKYTMKKQSVEIFMTTKDLVELTQPSKVMKEYRIKGKRHLQFAKSIHHRNEVKSIR